MDRKKKNKTLTQIRSADSAALGNEDILNQVEVTSGENTEKTDPHKEDSDMYIGQNPDESPNA